jgi:phenylacetate-CoA ligase
MRESIYRAVETFTRGFGPYRGFREMDAQSRLSIEETASLQLERLNNLLAHAVETVPYWKKVLGGNSPPLKLPLSSLEDLAELPLLDKQIIRREGDRMVSSEVASRNPYHNSSGGSTGEPVELTQDEMFRTASRAATALSRSWKGCSPYGKVLRIWGSMDDARKGRRSVKNRVRDWLLNRIEFNAFLLTPQIVESLYRTLEAKKPDVVEAYVDPIYQLARQVLRENRSVPSIKAVHSAAGTLTPEIRRTIDEAFHTRCFDHYGSREVSAIAAECSAHDGLHIFAPNQIVEVVDSKGRPLPPGEEGELVVTNLVNLSMPLIRYRIGDRGVMTSPGICSCGVSWPRLKRITGRTDEVFYALDGTFVEGGFFSGLLYHAEEVERFQVVQEQKDLIRYFLLLRPGQSMSSNLKADLETGTKEVMGDSCRVEIQIVQDIPPAPSGKMRYAINKLAGITETE